MRCIERTTVDLQTAHPWLSVIGRSHPWFSRHTRLHQACRMLHDTATPKPQPRPDAMSNPPTSTCQYGTGSGSVIRQNSRLVAVRSAWHGTMQGRQASTPPRLNGVSNPLVWKVGSRQSDVLVGRTDCGRCRMGDTETAAPCEPPGKPLCPIWRWQCLATLCDRSRILDRQMLGVLKVVS